ncbi:MAG TPA: FUSC family protein, partial [Dongiaceae bacterium]
MQIGLREINFSLKSLAGAMLAALISFELDLERPSWAILTAYIVAQPYAGMVQSKALYRVVGTLGGGIFAVAALGNLSSSPELLALVLALWLGLCVYFSLLDRTARSYAFMLAGYTASIICFPSVDTPGVIFDTAVSRCEEIILG